MTLSEETCICLVFGCVFLALIFRSLTAATECPQVIQPPSQECPPPPAPLPLPERQLTPEEQRYRLEAQLESQYRGEWAKDFEEQEQERYFREKFIQHENARQMEEARTIEQMKNAIRSGQMVGMGEIEYPLGQMGYPMSQAYGPNMMPQASGQDLMAQEYGQNMMMTQAYGQNMIGY